MPKMLLFQLEDCAVALLDPEHALQFENRQWQMAPAGTARKALEQGSQLTPTAFSEVFPIAAAMLIRSGYIGLDEIN